MKKEKQEFCKSKWTNGLGKWASMVANITRRHTHTYHTLPWKKFKKIQVHTPPKNPDSDQTSIFNNQIWYIQGTEEHVQLYHTDAVSKISTMGK